MKIHNITDFRDTGVYKHAKLIQPQLTDVQLVAHLLKKSYDNVFFTIRDSHVFETDIDTRIDIPGSRVAYDGIYDIWLTDCNNVASISVMFSNIEIPITEFKINEQNAIQIPLAFWPDSPNSGVKHLFSNSESCCFGSKNRVSYIPNVAIQFDNMWIKLNAGATCKVHISTVYFGYDYRRVLAQSQNIFYVNGVPLVARAGMVSKHTEQSNGCIIS